MSEPRNSSNSDATVANPELVMDVQEANAKYLLPAERQIPEGYKQTEAGVIPENWSSKPLFEVVSKIIDNRGKTPPYCTDGDVELIETASISFVIRHPDFKKVTKYVSFETYQNWFRAHPKTSDILISTVGEYSGSSSIMNIDRGTVAQNLIALRVKDANPNFVFYWTKSGNFKKQLNQVMMNQAQPSLRVPWLLNFNLSLPQDIAEQEAIAEALSDADALIEALEQLVAKIRQLKQGTMQELLTGKRRLPGFSGEWVLKVFNEICWYQEGPGVRNTQFTTSGIKLLNGTNIFRGVLNLETTNRFISEKEAYGAYAHFMANAGDIVIASSGITIERFHEKVAFVRNIDLPFCMNTSTIRFKPYSDVLASTFLYQFLTSDAFKRMIGGQATGSAQLNFGPSHISKVAFLVPPIQEQTAIAQILSDMDTEIAELETKLTKARGVKQGLMQQLLTGKIRLV